MKLLSRILNNLPKRFIAGGIIALGIALPVAASAAQTVNISATSGVANVTAGDTNYNGSTNASYDQVVKVEVAYTNDEAAGSKLVANDLHVKINIPTTAGATQTITTTTSGSNTNTVNGKAVVNLAQANGYLQYIPGSAQARITETNGTIENVVIPDSEIESTAGYAIDNGDPCQSAAVAVEARVMVPGVKITKQVEEANQSNAWTTQNTANPGDTLKYLITYENTGNTTQDQVIVRDNLPPEMTLVPNTTIVTDGSHPTGQLLADNDITDGGENLGNFAPGIIAYVTLEVKVPAAAQLACGQTEFRNVGLVQPQGMQQYINTATTDVNKSCTTAPAANYTCDSLNVTPGDNRTVTLSGFQETATNGATYADTVIDWGDTASLTTNNVNGQTHQYAAYGTYTVSAVVHFNVNGSDQSTGSTNCTKTVTFTAPTTSTTSTTAATPTALVNTGPGSVIALFGLTTVAGAVAHRLFSRRFARG
jgi:uncharacterized repeat protein (TIGR01451 family)